MARDVCADSSNCAVSQRMHENVRTMGEDDMISAILYNNSCTMYVCWYLNLLATSTSRILMYHSYLVLIRNSFVVCWLTLLTQWIDKRSV